MLDDMFRVIDDLARKIQDRFSVRTVYGDPITANGVTIVPVARVAFGFGGGGGSGEGTGPVGGDVGAARGGAGKGGGGGGGGGGVVRPVGYIEIIDGGSRWVPLERPRSEQALRAFVAALAAPGVGGGRGLLVRVLMAVVAQGLLGQLGRPDLRSILEGLRFGRGSVEGEA